MHANQQYGHLWDRPYLPRWDHVGGQYSSIFSRRIYMKIEFSPQRREMLLFLTTNMAAVMSHANQQELCGVLFFTCFIKISSKKTAVLASMIILKPEIWNRTGFLFDFLPCLSIATQQTYVLEFVKCLLHKGYEENFGKFSAVVGLF